MLLKFLNPSKPDQVLAQFNLSEFNGITPQFLDAIQIRLYTELGMFPELQAHSSQLFSMLAKQEFVVVSDTGEVLHPVMNVTEEDTANVNIPSSEPSAPADAAPESTDDAENFVAEYAPDRIPELQKIADEVRNTHEANKLAQEQSIEMHTVAPNMHAMPTHTRVEDLQQRLAALTKRRDELSEELSVVTSNLASVEEELNQEVARYSSETLAELARLANRALSHNSLSPEVTSLLQQVATQLGEPRVQQAPESA